MVSSGWKFIAMLVLVGCLSVGATADIMTYTNETAFVTALDTYYLEDFSSFSYGVISSPLSMGPVNGFSYDISVPEYLWSSGGNMSTNDSDDAIMITFTGDPVYALGGNFWATDYGFNEINGIVTLTFGDAASTVVTLTNSTSTTFRGFISSTPIASIMIGATTPGAFAWPAMDNFYVGTAATTVPVPGAFLLASLGVGFAGWLRKRRRL